MYFLLGYFSMCQIRAWYAMRPVNVMTGRGLSKKVSITPSNSQRTRHSPKRRNHIKAGYRDVVRSRRSAPMYAVCCIYAKLYMVHTTRARLARGQVPKCSFRSCFPWVSSVCVLPHIHCRIVRTTLPSTSPSTSTRRE